jgi:hypothetical protein
MGIRKRFVCPPVLVPPVPAFGSVVEGRPCALNRGINFLECQLGSLRNHFEQMLNSVGGFSGSQIICPDKSSLDVHEASAHGEILWRPLLRDRREVNLDRFGFSLKDGRSSSYPVFAFRDVVTST